MVLRKVSPILDIHSRKLLKMQICCGFVKKKEENVFFFFFPSACDSLWNVQKEKKERKGEEARDG